MFSQDVAGEARSGYSHCVLYQYLVWWSFGKFLRLFLDFSQTWPTLCINMLVTLINFARVARSDLNVIIVVKE